METKHLKDYAPAARREFIEAVTNKAALYGLLPDGEILPLKETGDVVVIGDRPFPRIVARQREELADRIQAEGFDHVIEAIAYTWFNRFVAIRYMELHGYLDHGYRVLSHPEDKPVPEILEHAERIDLPGLNRDAVVDLKLDGGKDEELYQLLLLAQCNALHTALPFLFEPVSGGAELLLPDNLLHTDSLIRTLVNDIPAEQWDNIEIIGWLYQFYISEKKDEVIGKVVKSEDIPAATQLFTPNWIVKYMVQNSLGAQWLATYPDSPLKAQMEYYIEPAEQTDEVNAQLAAITPDTLNPEELTLIDPACGSGHILVEAYDLFKAIYLERGYRQRDVPRLILERNLFGLDIDERAAQLTGFALMMKGRADDRRLFEHGLELNVMSLVDSTHFDPERLATGLKLSDFDLTEADLTQLKQLFEHATTFGSLIQVPPELATKLPALRILSESTSQDLFVAEALKNLKPLVRQAEILAAQYDAVVANPPYMGGKGMNVQLRKLAKDNFPRSRSDLFAIATECFLELAKPTGFIGLMTPFTWMFLNSFEDLRNHLLDLRTLRSLIQPEYHAFFESAYVPVCTFVFQNCHTSNYNASFIKLGDFYGAELQPLKTLEAIRNPDCPWLYRARPDDFKKMPGSPLAYWISRKFVGIFEGSNRLFEVAEPKNGLQTSDNDRFLRLWHEVAMSRIGFGLNSREQAADSNRRWFPTNKGGSFRKWYGNQEYVVDWWDDGQAIREFGTESGGRPKSRAQNTRYYFRDAVSWSDVTVSINAFRYFPPGFIHNITGPSAFGGDQKWKFALTAYCNNKFVSGMAQIMNPSMHFTIGDFGNLPCPETMKADTQADLGETCVKSANADWDAYERSWDFQSLPILTVSSAPRSTIESSYTTWIAQNRETIAEMQRLEIENNRLFIDAYGLADELTPEVPLEQITLTVNPAYRYGGKLTEEQRWTRFRQDSMEELISYAVGCMMGRYSLDAPGLILASQGETIDDYLFKVSSETELLDVDRAISDPQSVVFLKDVEITCFACGDKTSIADARFVINEYEAGVVPIQGRPLIYCPNCADVTRTDNVSWQQPLEKFSVQQALTAQWCEPETLKSFLQLAQCFGHRLTARAEELSFVPDDDGIIPLTDTAWFEDDAASRLEEFMAVAWPAEHLEENLTFLAENLSPRKNESSRDTLRRYLCDSFFKDHLKTYKKRPIYWLFSSGKQKAFQCLVYLHRYNTGTLSRMRSKYVVPLQGKFNARIDQLENDIPATDSTSHRKKLEKERDNLIKQREELQTFDETLRHYSDLRIDLDLDDGVKVNYSKFGNLLAEVKSITGKKAK